MDATRDTKRCTFGFHFKIPIAPKTLSSCRNRRVVCVKTHCLVDGASFMKEPGHRKDQGMIRKGRVSWYPPSVSREVRSSPGWRNGSAVNPCCSSSRSEFGCQHHTNKSAGETPGWWQAECLEARQRQATEDEPSLAGLAGMQLHGACMLLSRGESEAETAAWANGE